MIGMDIWQQMLIGIAGGLIVILIVSIIEFIKPRRYLFSWEDIPGNDNVGLIEFLNRNFGIDWVKTAKIEKIGNGKTIIVSTKKKFLTLKLNDEQTEVNLEIDDGKTDKFVAKIENSKLNIYPRRILESRKLKILIILLILIVFILSMPFIPNNESPQIQITDPKEGDNVPWRYTIKGTSNLSSSSDLKIYVFIYAYKRWYAQPEAVISLNGDWETRDKSQFGERTFSGLNYTYDVCAIVTTEDFEVDEQFAYLPNYIAKSVTIKVTRK